MLHGNAGKAFYKFAKFREVNGDEKVDFAARRRGNGLYGSRVFLRLFFGRRRNRSAGGAIYYTVMFDSRAEAK